MDADELLRGVADNVVCDGASSHGRHEQREEQRLLEDLAAGGYCVGRVVQARGLVPHQARVDVDGPQDNVHERLVVLEGLRDLDELDGLGLVGHVVLGRVVAQVEVPPPQGELHKGLLHVDRVVQSSRQG